MGYDIHITRAPGSWSDNAASRITADEWLEVVHTDPELRLDSRDDLNVFVRWKGPAGDYEPWFRWFDGDISTKQPDSATLRKAAQLAARLGGRVQGDDGEYYTGNEPIDEQIAAVKQRLSATPMRPWWRSALEALASWWIRRRDG
jgi:hypothetical protein